MHASRIDRLSGNTIFFIRRDQVPRDRIKDTTYGLITCLVRPEKIDEPNRTRLVAGGDRVHYAGDAGTPTANLLTVKLLINNIISTGITPASAVVRLSAAWMRASAGVKDGIVRYLCLKNTVLHMRVCLVHACVSGVDDVYFVAAVMFPRCSYVVPACCMWCPCLADAGY